MIYNTCQAVLLLRDTLSVEEKNKFVEKISNFIKQYTKGLQTISQKNILPLASKIEECSNAWYIAMQFRIIVPGYQKRISLIREKLNTYKEILDFKIVEKNKKDALEPEENQIFIVYEFDYGNVLESIEPRTTIFCAYMDKEKAIEKAYSLLKEGLENYYLGETEQKLKNPFNYFDEVELYEEKDKNKQQKPVYFIKIEKIKIE